MQIYMFNNDKLELDPLYKKTATGAIQEWRVWTEGNVIYTEYGQLDGKKQLEKEIIEKGKNTGKNNATTPITQAQLEAKSKWIKKNRVDYSPDLEKIKNQDGKLSKDKGFLPMLAHRYDKFPDKIQFSCYIQRKLDGIRLIAMKNNNKVELFSRTGKLITTLNHISDELNEFMNNGEILDGEAYNHLGDFSKSTGAIRAEKNTNIELVQKNKYHIYDYPYINNLTPNDTYQDRLFAFNARFITKQWTHLYMVETLMCYNDEQVKTYFNQFIKEQYEGAMLRNCEMKYIQKRSHDLLKVKSFDDAEFIIVDIKSGRGKLQGCAIFTCECNGDTFNVKMKGTIEELRSIYNNQEEYIGKMLTVQFFGYSSDGIPRFPVGLRIRSSIDY